MEEEVEEEEEEEEGEEGEEGEGYYNTITKSAHQ